MIKVLRYSNQATIFMVQPSYLKKPDPFGWPFVISCGNFESLWVILSLALLISPTEAPSCVKGKDLNGWNNDQGLFVDHSIRSGGNKHRVFSFQVDILFEIYGRGKWESENDWKW